MENSNPWIIENSSKSRLVCHTPCPEREMAYIARVTSKDQSNPKIENLLRFCVRQGHWSVFEQADMTVEVVTPLAISVQLLRHASFRFQQFSGRYENQGFMQNHTADLGAFLDMFYIPPVARLQDDKNRQNSIPVDDKEKTALMQNLLKGAYQKAFETYNELIEAKFAKEIARFVLPQGVYTRLYVKGNCRSWIHYLSVRDEPGVVQEEHVEVARSIRPIFSSVFPTVYRSIDWNKGSLEEENQNLKLEIVNLKEQLKELSTQKQ